MRQLARSDRDGGLQRVSDRANRRLPHPLALDALAAATEASGTARQRVAENLFATRTEQLRGRAGAQDEQMPVRPWKERLAGLAARPLPENLAGTGAA